MDFLAGLNPEQRAAAAHFDGPLLILAGAGSGKTRVITHRMAHLVDHHKIPGYSILAVTFTNKAAGEMKERVHSLVASTGENYENPTVATFHSFCVRLLRRDGDRLAPIRRGFTKDFNIYDDDDQLTLIKQIYKGLGLDDKFMQHRACLSRISQAKSQHETPEDFHKNARDPKASRLAVIYEQYENRLRDANAVDFDDLLLESVRLLRHDAELRQILNRRYAFLMVDEYQDTNRSQYELMRLLSETHSNVVAVGDEDQSIYSWRGADIRNILDFERDYAGAKMIRLEQNYRSTKNIIEAASAVVSNNTQRKGKHLWTDQAAGPKIGLYEAFDGENEALWVADRIDKILDRDPSTSVAILYRTNFQSRQIEEALRRYGRKYNIVGGLSFYQRSEIKDALSYLKLVVNPADSIALLRVINTPARGIGKTTLDQVEQFAINKECSLFAAITQMIAAHSLGARAEAALAAFQKLIEELREHLEKGNVEDLLRDILTKTGYQKMLEESPNAENEGRLSNLNELLNAAAEAAERGESITDFLDHAALVSDSDNVDESSQISMLTIHNAKGLEFPVVFLCGMEEGLFPHSRSLENDDQMEEERRLAYVGMTRARQQLHLSWARLRRRFGGGTPEPAIQSRFVREVPEHFTERLSRMAPVNQIDLRAEQYMARDTVSRYQYGSNPNSSASNISSFFNRNTPSGSSAAKAKPVVPVAPLAPTKPAPPKPTPPPPPAPPPAPPKAAAAQTSLFGPDPEPVKAAPTPAPKPRASSVVPPQREKPLEPPPVYMPAPRPSTKPTGPKPAGIPSGAVVMHPRYGKGQVLRREGDGDDAKLVISFPGYGLKKLVEKFAGIKRLD